MKIASDYKPVPQKEYDRTYFLTDCGGYANFIEFHGLKIDERMSKSLKLADIKPGMSVLDVGSGRGEIILHCAIRKSMAVGIDYSIDAIKLAIDLKNRYKTIGNKMFFLKGSATKLPFKNNVFDRIFLLDIVEHLYEYELDILFHDLNYILKDDGIIIIHTAPNKLFHEYGYKIIRFILYILKGLKLEKDIRTTYEKKMHVNEQTSVSLHKILKRNGFESKIRVFDSSHSDFLIREHLSGHLLSAVILSIINCRFFSQIFCRDIYAVVWKNSKDDHPGYVTRSFDDLGKIHETEYIPNSKDELVEDIVTDCIVMDKNQTGAIGNGWHHPENWPPYIRWTLKKATAYLKTDINSVKILINTFNAFPNMKGRILIDKKQIKNFEMQESEGKLIEVTLPVFCKKQIIEVTIELEKTWIPDKILKNGDTRELGIAVHKIWIE